MKLAALLLPLTLAACGLPDSIEVEQSGAHVTSLRYLERTPAGFAAVDRLDAPDWRMTGTATTAHRVALTLTRDPDGPNPCDFKSAGPVLGDGIVVAPEGVEVGIIDGDGVAVFGRLAWTISP